MLAMGISQKNRLIAHFLRACGPGLKSHSGQISRATSKNHSVVNIIYINVNNINVNICVFVHIKFIIKFKC